MSANWVEDIETMQYKYGVNEKVKEFDADKLAAYLQFRINFLKEEFTELQDAKSGDDAVDALIDLCVVAIGTLDSMGVDTYKAWDKVLSANLAKEVGIKATRPNPLGLPDLIKPDGWKSPSHADNVGLFSKLF
jgi:predicted HAD superfamily Cof-like phosphohydrolase